MRATVADPFAVRSSLVSPGSVLWDGKYTYVLLEGTAAELRVGRHSLGAGWEGIQQPELSGFAARRSLRNSTVRAWLHDISDAHPHAQPVASPRTGRFLAEIGVGTVHFESTNEAARFDPTPLARAGLALNQKLKSAFDPTGRLNPGVRPW